MRLALWSLAAIIGVGVAVVFVAPLFISAEDVRNRLFAEIEEATGYRLTVNGSLHISAFPTLKLVAEAHTSEQIAELLTISPRTVERHRENLMGKLGMRDRVQLTRYAIRRGLVEP